MRTKIGATLAAALMMLGLFGVSQATADPGPHHGNNKKGLCTAYFNGSEQGRENKRQAPPFQALEREAEEASESGATGEEAVAEFCEGLVGGNPGQADSARGNSNRP